MGAAGTLRLDQAEIEHLYRLAAVPVAPTEAPGEPAWTGFIQRLSAASPHFAQLWRRHEVASPGSRTKHFLHPEAGLLRLRSTSLAVADMPEARIVVYTPIDEETRQRLPLTRRG